MSPRACALALAVGLLAPAAGAQTPVPVDHDGDGYAAPADCNDNDAGIHPGAIDNPGDGIDQDCSGADKIDHDYDGWSPPQDCNDNDPNVHPGATENPGDGIDQDCNGVDATAPWQLASSGASAPAGTPAQAAVPALNPQIIVKWATAGRTGRVALLLVTQVVDGAAVNVTCKGHGCAFKRKTPKVLGGRAALTELFRNRAMRKGTVIRIAVTKAGATGRTFRVVVP